VTHYFQLNPTDNGEDDFDWDMYHSYTEGTATLSSYMLLKHLYNISVDSKLLDYLNVSLKMNQDKVFKRSMFEYSPPFSGHSPINFQYLLPALLYLLEPTNKHKGFILKAWKIAEIKTRDFSEAQLRASLESAKSLL